jgi:hypothetical protein
MKILAKNNEAPLYCNRGRCGGTLLTIAILQDFHWSTFQSNVTILAVGLRLVDFLTDKIDK